MIFIISVKMGRIYVKKLGSRSYKNYSQEQLARAVQAIKRGLGYKEASELFKIPRRTLWNKVTSRHQKTVGAPTALSQVHERQIVDVILTSAEFGSPITALDLRMLVKRTLDKCGKKVAIFNDNLPGKDWCANFLDRHKNRLSKRSCKNIKHARAEKSENEINEYFENLERSLEGVPESNILNYDETNLTDDPGSSKCIFRRGTKYPERVMNISKSSISIMFAITGSGESLPQYVVYKAERIYDQWTIGGPPFCRYNRTKSGWFDAYTFEDWFRTIAIPWADKIQGRKVIIGDNLSSHLNADIIIECQRRNIKFIFLPPNSTHITQPLDVGYYGQVKRIWKDILINYKLQNPREGSVNKTSFPVLLRRLVEKLSLNDKKNIRSAFKATGIIPIDKEQVLKKLPGHRFQENILNDSVSESLLDFLRETRTPSSSRKVRKKTIKIAPGKSVGLEVFNQQHEDDSDLEPEINQNPEQNFDLETEFNDQVRESEEDEDPNIVQPKPKINDFVVVEFPTKKTVKHYIGLILEESGDDFVIKFMRKRKTNVHVFPTEDDVALTLSNDVKEILPTPTINRGLYTFNCELSKYVL